MIKQRCPQCRRFQKLELESCVCGASLPRSARDVWCYAKRQGKRHFKRLGRVTKAEAEAAHAKWLTELLQPLAPKTEEIKLAAACEMYVDKLEAAGKPYYREARLFLSRLQVVTDPDIQLTDLTAEKAREYQRRIVNGGASLAYADRHVAIAKAMYAYVAPHLPNPFKLVKMFRPDNTLIRMLTDEQEANLIKHSGTLHTTNMPWLREIILVALRTGLRRNDILTLRWEQINFEARSIAVIQKGKRKLSVPMSLDLLQMFRWLHINDESEYIFPNRQTGKPYGHFDKTWKRLKAAAGIPANFRFHDLRHHVATKLARNTRNPLIVQQILGHSELRTTQKYMHAWNSDLTDAVDSL
jgi:integrase